MAIGFQITPNLGGFTTEQKLNKYPGLDEKEIKDLEYSQSNMSTNLTPTQLYQAKIKEKLAKQERDKKIELKNTMAYEAAKKNDPTLSAQVKVADINDTLVEKGREQLKAKGKDDTQYTDQQIIDGFKSKYSNEVYTNVLNGKLTIDDAIAGKTPEEPKGSTIKNIGEGMVSFGGGLYKTVTDIGLLDKPMAWVGENILNPIREAQGKEPLSKEEYSDFSQFTSGSQVGGDPESTAANVTEKAMIVGELISGGGWIKGAAKSRALNKLILEKMTPTALAKRGTQGLKVGKITGRVRPVLNAAEEEMKKIGGQYLKTGKTAVTNLNKIGEEITKESDNLVKLVKDNPYTFTDRILNSKFNKIKTPISAKGDKILLNKIKNMKDAFMEIWNAQQKKNAEGLLIARKQFDELLASEYKTLYTSDADAPIAAFVKELRKIPNELIDEKIGGDLVKESLNKSHNLLKISKNLKTKLEGVDTTSVSRAVTKNKQFVRGAGLLLGGAAGGSILSGL